MSIWMVVGIVLLIFFVKGLITKIINLPKTILQMVILGAIIYYGCQFLFPMS